MACCACCASTAVQQERGPRKNKGRRRLRVTSRRHDVITRTLVESRSRHLQRERTSTVTLPVPRSSCDTTTRHAGAVVVSRDETDWHRSAFTAVGRSARNTFADVVVNSRSSSNYVASLQSAPALDIFSQSEYRFISLNNLLSHTHCESMSY